MPHIKMYTGAFCPYCTMAKQLFRQVGVSEIEEIRVDKEPEQFAQIFIGQTHIGGFTDLYALHQKGELLALLSAE